MVSWMRMKGLRKPAALVGTACTGMLVGVLMFDKFLMQSSQSKRILSFNSGTTSSKFTIFSNQTSKQPSFIELKNHQVSRVVHGSTFKKFDAVFLGSNSPIEDRFSIGISENLDTALFSIIDGHRGTHCSQYLQKMLNWKVSEALHGTLGIKNDLSTIMDMDKAGSLNVAGNGNDADIIRSDSSVKVPPLTVETLQSCLKRSFVKLDREISNAALAEVKKIRSGYSMTAEMKEAILTAVDGACALTAVVQKDSLAVASTGDCRVVLGHRSKLKWDAIALSEDQNVHNQEEVNRLRAAHPGEENTVIAMGRVLGSLMPFRTFGDVDYKWDVGYLQGLLPVLPNYRTPPYITAEPVLSQHIVTEGDKFLILATDGLWERMTNQEAVDVVAGVLSECSKNSKEGDPPCSNGENAATHLLWHALGGNEANVSRMLELDPQVRRMYRDDITILVVYL